MADVLAREYPFRSRWFALDGLRYHYLDEGPRDAAPLLFVHGNPTWSFAWRNLIRALSPEFRCLAVDHIGCGLSDKPQLYDYRLYTHIRNLRTFVEFLDLKDVTLVAHDWGGCIGMGVAGLCPERFSRFVLMNTAAFRSSRMPWRIAICRWPVLGALGVRGFNLFARAALRMAVRNRPLAEAVRRGYLAPYDNWGHRIAIHRFVQDIPLRTGHQSDETLAEVEQSLRRQVDKPMLLAWGMRDWCFTPEFLAEWRGRFPGARVLELPQAGHYVFEDASADVAAAIRAFLTVKADREGDHARTKDAG